MRSRPSARSNARASGFADWRTLPEPLRGDPDGTRRYVDGIGTVAQFFHDVLGEASLLGALIGTPAANPLWTWDRRISACERLMDEQRYEEAEPLVRELVEEIGGRAGNAVDQTRLRLRWAWSRPRHCSAGRSSVCWSKYAAALAQAGEWAREAADVRHLRDLTAELAQAYLTSRAAAGIGQKQLDFPQARCRTESDRCGSSTRSRRGRRSASLRRFTATP